MLYGLAAVHSIRKCNRHSLCSQSTEALEARQQVLNIEAPLLTTDRSAGLDYEIRIIPSKPILALEDDTPNTDHKNHERIQYY